MVRFDNSFFSGNNGSALEILARTSVQAVRSFRSVLRVATYSHILHIDMLIVFYANDVRRTSIFRWHVFMRIWSVVVPLVCLTVYDMFCIDDVYFFAKLFRFAFSSFLVEF